MPWKNKEELVVTLTNGVTIRSNALDYRAGDYVRVCDPSGKEVGYWDSQEWADDPVSVMGAILGCAYDTNEKAR